MTVAPLSPPRPMRWTADVERLQKCPRCGESAVYEDPHEHGTSFICMICGESWHLDNMGNPVRGEVVVGNQVDHANGQRHSSFPKGMTSTRFRMYYVPGDRHHPWALAPYQVALDVLVHHYPKGNYSRYPGRRIYNSEVRASGPHAPGAEGMLDRFLREPREEVKLRRAIRLCLMQLTGENVVASPDWLIYRWGHLLEEVELDQRSRNEH